MVVNTPSVEHIDLWHLFSVDEIYKLKTFLAGGLWCAELGSIIGFDGDSEGAELQGTFVSCWHAAETNPTEAAWKIFGGDGNGFAIGTTREALISIAAESNANGIRAKVCQVAYLPAGTVPSEPGCQVQGHHSDESELRFVLEVENKSTDESALRRQICGLVSAVCKGRSFPDPIRVVTLSISDSLEIDALIVPIDPHFVFKQFLVGGKVDPRKLEKVQGMLDAALVTPQCRIRKIDS